MGEKEHWENEQWENEGERRRAGGLGDDVSLVLSDDVQEDTSIGEDVPLVLDDDVQEDSLIGDDVPLVLGASCARRRRAGLVDR